MSKLQYNDVKQEIEQSGWKLLSTTYSNLKTDLELECPEGHLVYCCLNKFRNKPICPTCKNNPLSNFNENATKKQGYRILAIDQATITSGWAIYENDALYKYGKWTTDGKGHIERVSKTKYWLASMISKWQPDLIILEDIQLQKFDGQSEGVLTYKKLAALQGVLINYIYESGISYQIIPPATWRNFNEIKGRTRNDQKKNAQLKVKRLYDISVTQDEADAILIGRYGANKHKQNQMIEF